jgi:UDP-N-acetyl-D-mannosaminuronate dehydrogenase
MGVAYRSEVDDTRYSPSEAFVQQVIEEGGIVACHDPFVRHWPEMDLQPLQSLPPLSNFDAVVLAVAHRDYAALDLASELADSNTIVVDANGVLRRAQQDALSEAGVRVVAVGRGD